MDEGGVNDVFLHSENLNSEFMVKCLTMLVNTFPGISITSFNTDELHSGFRVYFSTPPKAFVLARKHLVESGSGQEVRIGPLRTWLTIHGVRKNGGEQLEVEIRETLENKFGNLLRVHPVLSVETPGKMNLRACVAVPELRGFEIFTHEGYPDVFICLPSNAERLKVTFHCRRCKNDGHVQRDCPLQTLDDETRTMDSDVSNSSNSSHSFTFNSGNRDDGTSSSEDFSSTSSSVQGVFPFLFRNTAGPSSGNHASPLTRGPSFVIEDTKILSPPLQWKIDKACEQVNILDRNQLDSFLFYVKNKSNPLKIARIYTSNVGRVKTLLQRIISLFHNPPLQEATTDDKKFLKRLAVLVERFEETILWRDLEETL